MKKVMTGLLGLGGVMFAVAPVLIGLAPYESTMGLVQKIFYFHVPAAWFFMLSVVICGWSSARYLFSRRAYFDHRAVAAAELAAVFGLIVLVTGPLWGRKAWGVYWQWDARLTSSLVLWMTVVSYVLLRQYGGPGSDRLAAAVALFGVANVPFVILSVNLWRTVHPLTSVVPTLKISMGFPFWWCAASFLLLFVALFTARVALEEHRARVDELYRTLDA
ncbi:MAG: cytochrome c biogenesis protein CcsA [Vicinamibacterales bacterium]